MTRPDGVLKFVYRTTEQAMAEQDCGIADYIEHLGERGAEVYLHNLTWAMTSTLLLGDARARLTN